MNAQQLKNAILQEAIEGRLVPQDPNDEPASILLERIRAEKERLVKEGKLKKKELEVKPISEDEIPFEIPDTWEWVRLKTISRSVSDGDHMPPPKADCGIPFLVISNIIKGYIDFSNTRFVPQSYYDNITLDRKAEKGDVLFTVTGSYGKAVLNDTDSTFCFQRHIALIKPLIYSAFVELILNSPYIKAACDDKATGMAQKTVGIDTLRSFVIPLPPLAEQKRIVAKIEELLPKVEKYGKAQDELNKLNEELPERLKKSILQEAIEGRLVPQDPNDEPASVLLSKIRKEKEQLVKAGKLKKKDLIETPISEDEIPFEIPDTWEWVRMQNVMEFINGRAYKKDELLEKGKYKVLRVGNLFTNDSWYYSNLELDEDKYCYNGDLLYAWSASFGPHIWEGEKTIFHYHIWNVKYNQCVLYREYLYYFFLIDKMKIKGSTTGSTMVHVSMENMKPRLIPLPPLAEQKRIVAKIEQLLGEIDKLKK